MGPDVEQPDFVQPGATKAHSEGLTFKDVFAPLEENPVRRWVEVRLRATVAEPDGYSSWQEAATAEKIRRIKAEQELSDPSNKQVYRFMRQVLPNYITIFDTTKEEICGKM